MCHAARVETATLIAAGWCSGINAYLTVLLLGLAGRFGWADTPLSLQRPWVLIAAGVLFAIEFVVDKVPVLDSLWDVAHTLVRPGVAAAVGTALAGAELGRPQAAILAGGLALTGHASKATTRLAINMSPEPFTNIIASVSEDGLVATLVSLAMASPRVAAAITVAVMAIGVVVAVSLFTVARRGYRVLRRRIAGLGRGPDAPSFGA